MRGLHKALWGTVMVLEKHFVGAVHLPFTNGLHVKEQKCQVVEFYELCSFLWFLHCAPL